MKSISKNLPKCIDCAIRTSALFGELETQQIDKARSLRSAQQTYKSGEYLYHEGDTAIKAFTVYSGWVTLFKNLKNDLKAII